MLKQRLITAAILVPIVIFATLYLPIKAFAVLAALVFILAAFEWGKLIWRDSRVGLWLFVLVFVAQLYLNGVMLGLMDPLNKYDILENALSVLWVMFSLGFSVLWWLFSCVLLWRYPKKLTTNALLSSLGQSLLGLVVLFASLSSLVFLSVSHWHGAMVLILISIVVLADSAAYFSGKRWGVNKLAPQLSPGKTREGLYGAVVTVALFSVAVSVALRLSIMNALLLLVIFVVTALFSVIGDLYESLLKRRAGVKDSGAILPGHGGILDRIDGLIAAAPFFTFAMMLVGPDLMT